MFFGKKKAKEKPTAIVVAQETAPVVNEVVPEPVKPVKAENTNLIKRVMKSMDYEVLINKNTAVNGNISIQGFTRIDGIIDGSIAVEGDLVVGEVGTIRAAVFVQNAVISGYVEGDITCRGRLELTSTAKIKGNIRCGVLVIAEGATFRGKSMGFDEMEETEAARPIEAVPAPVMAEAALAQE